MPYEQREKTLQERIRDFITHLHILFIRLVALNKQLIIGVHFRGGIVLDKDTKRLYIANCHLEGPEEDS